MVDGSLRVQVKKIDQLLALVGGSLQVLWLLPPLKLVAGRWFSPGTDKVYQLLAHGRWFSPGARLLPPLKLVAMI